MDTLPKTFNQMKQMLALSKVYTESLDLCKPLLKSSFQGTTELRNVVYTRFYKALAKQRTLIHNQFEEAAK